MTMAQTITGLEIQKKNKKRVSVYLDDSYAFSVGLIAAAALFTGQELDERRIEELKETDEHERAYLDAIRFLGYRARSIAETKHYLKGRKFSSSTISLTVTRLSRENYLNDLDFSAQWIENRRRLNPKGGWALRQELKDKGVDDHVIDGLLSSYNENVAAFSAVEKKIDQWKSLDPDQVRQKIYTYLSQRGFSYETTLDVITKIISDHI
jgi:regulatory protein